VSYYVFVPHALKFAFFSQRSSHFWEARRMGGTSDWQQAFCHLGARRNENSELSCQQQLVAPVLYMPLMTRTTATFCSRRSWWHHHL
jgi:hypothetical protein